MGSGMSALQQFMVEAWIEYGIGVLVIFTRLFARWKTVGFEGWKADDALMFLGLMFLTAETVVANVVGNAPGTNTYLTDEMRENMSAKEEAGRQVGAKGFLGGWFTYVGVIWSLKCCMLIFFGRLTQGLPESRYIKPVLGFVVGAWTVIYLTVFLRCRPFSHYWQVKPDPGSQCEIESHTFYILVLSFNIVSDAVIIAIPVPLLIRAKMPLLRKLALLLMFTAGAFVMIAAVLRVVFSFTDPGSAQPAIWACRESLVAIIVGNIPMIRPLFSKRVWTDISDSSGRQYQSNSNGLVELANRNQRKPKLLSKAEETKIDSDSTEHIVNSSEEPEFAGRLVIQTQRTVEVTSEEVDLEANPRVSTCTPDDPRPYTHYSAQVGS